MFLIGRVIEIHGEILNDKFLKTFLEECCSESIFLKSTTVKGNRKYLEYVSKDEKQVTDICCLICNFKLTCKRQPFCCIILIMATNND